MATEGNARGDGASRAALEAASSLLLQIKGDIDRVLELLERSSDGSEAAPEPATPDPDEPRSDGGWERWIIDDDRAVRLEHANGPSLRDKWAPPSE